MFTISVVLKAPRTTTENWVLSRGTHFGNYTIRITPLDANLVVSPAASFSQPSRTAKADWVMFSGFRNSSSNISPGRVGGR